MHRAFRSATLDIILAYCFAKDYAVVHVPGFTHQLLLDYELSFPLVLVMKHFPWLYDVLVLLGAV